MNLDELSNQILAMERVISDRTAELKAMKQAKRKLEAALEKLRAISAKD